MNVARSSMLMVLLAATAGAAPPDGVGPRYEGEVRPILKQFCLNCHSTELQEGDLDLEQFATFDRARKEPRIWQKVVAMIDDGEMPPKKKPQPTAAQREQLRDWVRAYLDAEAKANAGDPGPVLLRRLNNVEYDNTVRDLTGVDLRPAREFPADGAAGEGFTNVGEAMAMSPAMLDKYVAAAKGIASHAILLPDGFRFADKTTRRDWTDAIVADIRRIYRDYTDPAGSTRVNLQGLVWDTNSGGRIPLEHYLTATLKVRDRLAHDPKAIETVAAEDHLSAKYLRILWETLDGREPSTLIDPIRNRWRTARPDDVPAIAAEIRAWQGALTKFNSVAHFKTWMEPVSPLASSRAIRLKLEPAAGAREVVLRLATRGTGDVAWQGPRLESPGRPAILLRDVRGGLRGLDAKRKSFAEVARYLDAADEARNRDGAADVEAIAKGRHLDPAMLGAWFDYLGIVGRGVLKVDTLFTQRLPKGGGYIYVNGWGLPETPSILANASNNEVRIPGIMRPHAVVVHPSPTQNVAIGWSSPLTGKVRVEARVVHAHPDCGNGVAWAVELRRGGGRRRLAGGELNLGQAAKIEPIDGLAIQSGDLLSLLVGPRDGNHACDLTEVDLTIIEAEGAHRRWSLAREVSPDILAGNPHADAFGRADAWHFYQEPIARNGPSATASIPLGSILDLWRDEPRKAEREKLAGRLRELLAAEPTPNGDAPDAALYRQLTSSSGPLLGKLDFARLAAEASTTGADAGEFGLPRSAFGPSKAAGADLVAHAPNVLEVRLPAELIRGREFVATASMASPEGSAQADATVDRPPAAGLVAGVPILVRDGGSARARLEASIAEFRRVLPAAVCYPQVVPVDEVVTLVLFHREDEGLARLMLDEAEGRTLVRLWDELRYVSQDALKVKEAYVQFMEYVTQDGDVRIFEPLRKPIAARAEALRARLIATEPKHLDALAEFASRAYRRPLTIAEAAGLRRLYADLRKDGLDHDAAFRLTLARVLMAPSFLYRSEEPADGPVARPVSDWELASRLSYVLWASTPDDELRRLAGEGKLRDPEVLMAQARRMFRDDRARAFATEFACQWLDIRGFDRHDEKSGETFPQFAGLRGAMYEESVRFFVDLFRRDGSLLEVLDSDHTFADESLAKFYGLPGVTGPDWRRVDGVKARGRGGVLGMAALLAKQSGASRTSPVLRGNWVLETLLGERLPKPPKNVPQLPESELNAQGRSMRQLTEAHRADPSCAKCHDKIDPFGFALEAFDAIGHRRAADLGGHPVDTRARLKDGTEFSDISGLRDYLLANRRDEFVGQFCRKLLGYSLGREVQLSDGPLLEDMRRALAGRGYHVQDAVSAVLRSPQFRTRRGLGSPLEREVATQ